MLYLIMKKIFNYDPVDLAQQSIDDNFNSQVWDPRLEKDIYYAKNWFEWISSSEFLNFVPWGKQVEIGAKLFEDYCPRCSDLRFLDGLFNESINEMQDRITWLEDGVCPKCKTLRNYWYKEINPNTGLPYFQGKNEVHLCIGQRSGKSATTAMIASYVLHRYIQLPDPAQYFNQLPNQKLDMAFVALTAKNAQENLWEHFRSKLDSPWFNYYFEWANDIKKKTGNTLIVNNTTFLKINHKHLHCGFYPADYKTLRGPTRFFEAIDELGWFDNSLESKKIKMNASETRTSLTNSLTTLRTASILKKQRGNHNVVDAFEVNISSPSSANDPIMRLVKGAHKKSTAFSFHLATWEMNPQLPQDILRSQQDVDKIKDFDRDFGAIPPLADSPFIKDKELVMAMFGDHSQTVIVKNHKEKVSNKVGFKWIELQDIKLDSKVPRIVTVDPGYSNNAFGVSLSHVEKTKLIVDWCFEIKPHTEDKVLFKVNFPKFFDLFLMPLVKQLNIVGVIYDRWNSQDQIQRLIDEGINALQYSLVYKDFDKTIKSFILSKLVVLPACEMKFEKLEPATALLEEIVIGKPVLNMALQILTVRDLGKKIVKPENGDDDIFRTLALAIWFVSTKEGKEKLNYFGEVKQNVKRSIGISMSRSLKNSLDRNTYQSSIGSSNSRAWH